MLQPSNNKAVSTWRLSRSILSQNSDIWDFHASWCRFVEKRKDNLSKRHHRHAIYELHCLLVGSATVFYDDGREVVLHAGEFLLIPPRIYHRFVYTEDSAMKLVTGFSVKPHTESLSESFHAVNHYEAQRQSQAMKNLIDTLILKAEQYYSVSSGFSIFLLQCIVLECLESMHPLRSALPQAEMKNSLDDVRLDDAKKYISENITLDITGLDVAAHLGVSLRQLNRLCNEAFDHSAGYLIRRMKMQYAQNLLEISPLSLSDIAESLHYSSVYAFIRAFKSVMDTTPGKYQKDASSR